MTCPPSQVFAVLFSVKVQLIIKREPASHGRSTRGRALTPVFGIVHFKSTARREPLQVVQTGEFLNFWRRRLIDDAPGPNLGLSRPTWVPDANGAGDRQERKGRKYRSDAGSRNASARPKTILYLGPYGVCVVK